MTYDEALRALESVAQNIPNRPSCWCCGYEHNCDRDGCALLEGVKAVMEQLHRDVTGNCNCCVHGDIPCDQPPCDASADVAPRQGLTEQVKDYAASMEKMVTNLCEDYREETGGDSVCGYCQYNDCAYVGADGDWIGECPGFESNSCFALDERPKRKIWEIVDIVSGVKMDGGEEHGAG